jgi:hypothetical protein
MTEPITLPPLAAGEWSLDDVLIMGPHTGRTYNVQTFTVGAAPVREQTAVVDAADGDRFGVDTLGGRLITLELNTDCYTEAEGLDAAEAFEAGWDAEDIRTTPGAVSVLRWRRGTRVRRAYGRTRPPLLDHSMDWTGNIGITATFKTVDPLFYDDTEQVEIVDIVPDDVGGLAGDLVGDVVASGQAAGQRGFTVGGTKPTWLPVLIRGPITNPEVEIVGQWTVKLVGVIGVGAYVLIDPTPWTRDVRRSDGANVSGMLTAESQFLSGMRVRPGYHEAILRGTDPTGTARAELYWRSAHGSH